MIKIAEPINGHEIIRFINSPKERRKPIVEGLIYERSCVMFASQPGVGKSTVMIQMCLEMSAGLPVFGAFKSFPTKIYYIQKERPIDEIAERVEEMQKTIPWNPDNLIVDSELQTFSFANEKNFSWITKRIMKHNPNLIFLDPIGAGTPGLSKDEPANSFCNFLTMLQKETGATNVLGHHAVKDSYDDAGDKIVKDDPFYGSQWIKAHVTGSYFIEEIDGGRRFINKKDSHSNLIKRFDTSYDNESMMSTSKNDSLTTFDRAKQYFNAMKTTNQRFIEKKFREYLGCAPTTSREIFRTPPFDEKSGIIIRHKVNGSATLYEVKEFI